VCVELMVLANTVTVAYAAALLVATPDTMLIDGKKTAKLTGLASDQMARMAREMTNLQGQYKNVEQTYGQDVLNLVLARGYLAKLGGEQNCGERFLKLRPPEVLAEFESVVQTGSLDQ
jgi:hypothetical protein